MRSCVALPFPGSTMWKATRSVTLITQQFVSSRENALRWWSQSASNSYPLVRMLIVAKGSPTNEDLLPSWKSWTRLQHYFFLVPPRGSVALIVAQVIRFLPPHENALRPGASRALDKAARARPSAARALEMAARTLAPNRLEDCIQNCCSKNLLEDQTLFQYTLFHGLRAWIYTGSH